jgi:hypothetical protein
MPYAQLSTDAPTRARNVFCSQVTRFWRDTSHHFETPTWNFYQEVYEQKWYQNGLLIALLEESCKEYLQASLQLDSALTGHYEKTPQEPWKSRRLQEKDVERSALTHACHTHSASRQLGTTADWRYDVLWDWLWDACQMARVHWGTHCEGFCSKEGPHYRIERNARNQLERNQVQRALVKLSRSCPNSSNNQLWFMTWEILWGFLAWAVLCWLSRGLCHVRKCQFKDFFVRRKGMICKLPTDVCIRNLWGMAELETGTNSCTGFPRVSCFEKMRYVCQKYGGGCTMWHSENQRYKKNGMRNWIPAQPRRVWRN